MSEGFTPQVSMVSVMEDVKRTGRVQRRPKHNFHVRHAPFVLQPFLLAPVLPGDTLKSLSVRARAVTDVLVSSLIGWWLDHHFYYVPFSAIENGETETMSASTGLGPLKSLLLSPTADLTTANWWTGASPGASAWEGRAAGGTAQYNWVRACTKTVIKEYFRDENELAEPAATQLTVNAINRGFMVEARDPANQSWMQSAAGETVVNTLTGNILEGDITPEAADPYYEAYLAMRGLALTDLTYEAWLRDQGIRTAVSSQKNELARRPERLRSDRSWTLPSITPDATGAVASVCYWSDIDRSATKPRFFDEPGFILGLTVARPKVYLGAQLAPAANHLMNSAFSWFPKALAERPELRMLKFADGAGPFPGNTDAAGYWVDIADLFIHGDDFVTELAAADANVFALPAAATLPGEPASAAMYPTWAMIKSLFKSTAADTVYEGRTVRQDGRVTLEILSRLRDATR